MSGAEDGNLFGEERKTRIDSIMRGDGPWRGHRGVRSLCKSQFSNLRLTPGMQGEETSDSFRHPLQLSTNFQTTGNIFRV